MDWTLYEGREYNNVRQPDYLELLRRIVCTVIVRRGEGYDWPCPALPSDRFYDGVCQFANVLLREQALLFRRRRGLGRGWRAVGIPRVANV